MNLVGNIIELINYKKLRNNIVYLPLNEGEIYIVSLLANGDIAYLRNINDNSYLRTSVVENYWILNNDLSILTMNTLYKFKILK